MCGWVCLSGGLQETSESLIVYSGEYLFVRVSSVTVSSINIIIINFYYYQTTNSTDDKQMPWPAKINSSISGCGSKGGRLSGFFVGSHRMEMRFNLDLRFRGKGSEMISKH